MLFLKFFFYIWNTICLQKSNIKRKSPRMLPTYMESIQKVKYLLETEGENCPMVGGSTLWVRGLEKGIPADLPKNLREVSQVRRGEAFGLPCLCEYYVSKCLPLSPELGQHLSFEIDLYLYCLVLCFFSMGWEQDSQEKIVVVFFSPSSPQLDSNIKGTSPY